MVKTSLAKYQETEIGLIPEEWDVFSVYDIVDIFGGGTPDTFNEDYWGGDIPWLSVTDFNNESRFVYDTEKKITKLGLRESSTYLLKKGQIIISARGTVGAMAQLGRDMAFNQSCYGLAGKNGISNDFVYYLLRNVISDFKHKSHGAVFDTITRNTFKNVQVPIPSDPDERGRITEILSSLDKKIELNQRVNANLERMVGSLFKKLFIDKDDELPKGWKVGKISDLAKVESGFPFSRSMFDDAGQYKLVTIKNVQDGYFVPDCTDSLSVVPEKMPLHCHLKNGDILLSLTGNVGRVCIVTGENYLLNQRVAVLNPVKEENRALVYILFRQKDFQNTLMGISHGTAQQNLSPIETKSLEISIPPETVLREFGQVANPIFEILTENLRQIQSLSTLRDYLLPRLMNGKIRV